MAQEVENSLAFTCIKSECPGHSQRRRGGLKDSNDCCINLLDEKKQTVCSLHVYFILKRKSLIYNY